MNPLSLTFQQAAEVLAARGWTKGDFEDAAGRVCEEGAVLKTVCTPGDQHLARQVLIRRGFGAGHNDADETTAEDAFYALLWQPPINEAEMAATFSPQWQAIRDLVRRAAVLTDDEARALAAAWVAAWGAARGAAWDAARDAAWDAAWDAARDAARDAAWDAARALVARDLIGQHGFTQEHYDLLTGPWRQVIGPVHPDDAPIGGAS